METQQSLIPSPNVLLDLPHERREKQKALLTACRELAQANCFTITDKDLGRSLAATPWERWTPDLINTARVMLMKYRDQLGFSTFDIPPATMEQTPAEPPLRTARARYATIEFLDNHYFIRFPSHPGKQLLKKLEDLGAVYLKTKGYWRVQHNPIDAPKLADLLEPAGVRATEGLYETLRRLPARLAEREQKSRATSSTLSIPGIAGTPYPFQLAGAEYALEAKRTFIADEAGLGKSLQSLMVIHAARAYPAVIVCPASVLLNWLREINKWIPSAYAVILNSGKFWSGINADIMITTYGQFGTWAGEMVDDTTKFHRGKKIPKRFEPGALCDKEIRTLVLDESQNCKEKSTRRTQIVLGFVEHCKTLEYRLLLSGTPMLNRPKELIAQLEILGRLQDFGGYHFFTRRYCNGFHDRFGEHADGHGSNSALVELNQRLRKIGFLRREKSEVLTELPEKRHVTVPLEIDNRKEYESAEADIANWCAQKAIENEDFQAAIAQLSETERQKAITERHSTTYWKTIQIEALARIGKLRQIAARGKYKAAMEWLENLLESDEKVILFAEHVDMQKMYLNGLRASEWAPTHLFGDDDPKTVRPRNIDTFQQDPKCRVIVCSLDAGHAGWTGTASSNVVLTEFGWTPSKLEQASSRAHRIGQRESVTAWYLIGNETIDVDTLELIEAKAKVVTAAATGVLMPEGESILKDLMKRLAAKGRK